MKKAIKWIVAGAAIAGAGAYIVNRIISKKREEEAEMFHACHCGGDCKCDGEHKHEHECCCGDNCGCGEDHACECNHEEGAVCDCACHDAEEPRVDIDAMPAEEVATEEVAAEDKTPVE